MPQSPDFPYQDGDVTVLGPEVFASADGQVISWRGENYVRQAQPDFTSPLAGRVEVRKPCPHCGDRQMVPASQYAEHVARLHPDVRTTATDG